MSWLSQMSAPDLQHRDAPVAAGERDEPGFGMIVGCSTARHATSLCASIFTFSENGDVS